MDSNDVTLNQMWKQQDYKKKPILDEQQIEEINVKLQLAIHNDLTVIIKYYKNHDYKSVRSKLDTVDVLDKHILLCDGTRIKLHDIIDLQID
ncbi:YolD-like family protein [Ornithinibacillus sp. 179-J 7C1 HS]|uniref:YolD-like family protein n=1 Tax=Ornithinibacillus sp. 179-J 7C1 HS TaxID=3142384 RepID=UPI00399F56E9